jgi:hypothetical protein
MLICCSQHSNSSCPVRYSPVSCDTCHYSHHSPLWPGSCAASSIRARFFPVAFRLRILLPLLGIDFPIASAIMRRSDPGACQTNSSCDQLTKAWGHVGQILPDSKMNAFLLLREHTICLPLGAFFTLNTWS